MKYSALLCITFACLLISGCKKDDKTQLPAATKHRIKQVVFSYPPNPTVTWNYTYDSLGRQTAHIYEDGISRHVYSENVCYKIDGTNNDTTIYTLNAEGYALNANYGSGIESTYQYNSEGNRTGRDGVINREWLNGNLVKITGSQDVLYTYYEDKDNIMGESNFGKLYVGKDSKNLLKAVSYGGTTVNYEYEFDPLNKIVKRFASNGNVETYTYY